MKFDGDKIGHMTRIWHSGIAMQELGCTGADAVEREFVSCRALITASTFPIVALEVHRRPKRLNEARSTIPAGGRASIAGGRAAPSADEAAHSRQ